MKHSISRRDFIKLLGLAAVTYAASPQILTHSKNLKSNQDKVSPNILILLFDALSARHMSTYGYQRETTPNISKFADRSIIYHNHYAAGNFTSPGTASLLTGVYPWSHRNYHLYGTVTDHFIDKNIFSLYSPSHFVSTYTHNTNVEIMLHQFMDSINQLVPMNSLGLLGESYAERFFPTDLSVATWSETLLRGLDISLPGLLMLPKLEQEILRMNLSALKSDYRDIYPDGLPHNFRGLIFVLEQAIDWIKEQLISLPQSFLAYYHLYPPHGPYRPRADFKNIFDASRKGLSKPEHKFTAKVPEERMRSECLQYDEYIAFVDSEFGRLVTFMEQESLLDNTIMILTSDHGELFERGITGHLTPVLYENILRIPLLISLPNQDSRKDIYSQTSCIDLIPTLLQIVGHQIPDYLEGEILPGFDTSINKSDRSIFAIEAKTNSKFKPLEHCSLALIIGRYKLLHYRGYDIEVPDELYDLENDPEELDDLSKSKCTLLKEMQIELFEKLEESNQRNFDGS